MNTDPTIDAELDRSVRRTAKLRQGFYLVVLGTALAGQVSGAVEALGIPLIGAIPAVGALELGGVVVLANADVRRRLGEHANASRVLSAAIAAGAVAFNWLAHSNHLLGGFFAGMSALGYLVWLMHTENQRRDRLRAKGDLPPTSPVYGAWRRLRHPLLTRRAREHALRNVDLGLYGSWDAARSEVRGERRRAAISKVLHRKIRAAVDPKTADIAVAVYDLDEIATRLASGADYAGLTALIAADLQPARMLAPVDDKPEPLKPVLVVEDEIQRYYEPPAEDPDEVFDRLTAKLWPQGRPAEGDDLDVPPGLFDQEPPTIAALTELTPEAPPIEVPDRTRSATRARTHLGHRRLVQRPANRVHPDRPTWPAKVTPTTHEPEPEAVPAEPTAKRRPPIPNHRILAALKDAKAVPRRPDGTVAVRDVERRFNCRQDRAKRLLIEAGLYQSGDGEGVPARVNGTVPAGAES